MALKSIKTKEAFLAALEDAEMSKGLIWTDLFKVSPELLELILEEGVVGTTEKNGKTYKVVNIWDYQFNLKAKSLDDVTKVVMHTFDPPKGASWNSFNAGALA